MDITNTLAYYDSAIITSVKSFVVQALQLELIGKEKTLAYYTTQLIMAVKKVFSDEANFTKLFFVVDKIIIL